jgi:polyferredoxin
VLRALKGADAARERVLAGIWRRGSRYRARRVVVVTLSLAVLLAVPLTGIARVDLWDGRHVLLGEAVPATTALKGVVVAIAALWGTTFVVNTIVGRFFCGWGCPVGYVGRLGEDVAREKRRSRRIEQQLAGAGFVGAFVASVMLWWVDPRVVAEGSWTARAAVLGAFLALSFGGFLHAFMWRFLFCLKVCPIGLYYRYVTSKAPVGIQFLEVPDPCVECGACVNVCPVDVDPRRLGEPEAGAADTPVRYGDAECLRCGDCVDACRMVFLLRPGKRAPLRFGSTTPADATCQGDQTRVPKASAAPPSADK